MVVDADAGFDAAIELVGAEIDCDAVLEEVQKEAEQAIRPIQEGFGMEESKLP
jgi:hypothetical protein